MSITTHSEEVVLVLRMKSFCLFNMCI
uniref:Uncharacterized protein n=1 Tax=Anguilla anguilla TaxID=7936 RepID=A0A0E9UG82_ANGAN